MKGFLFLLSLCCMMLVPMTASAAPLPGEPSWEYIEQKYPNGITMAEASAEGITQHLCVYFEGYMADEIVIKK